MQKERGHEFPERINISAPLTSLSDDVGSLWHRPKIPILDRPPSTLAFLRDHVSPGTPCIIRHAIPSRPLTDGRNGSGEESSPLILTLDDLVEMVPENELTVNVTPDGHGDCVRDAFDPSFPSEKRKMFVTPEERQMTLREFRNELREGRRYRRMGENTGDRNFEQEGLVPVPLVQRSREKESPGDGCEDSVLYYSRQNDCLRTELPALFSRDIFPSTIPFAEEAFSPNRLPPDAINLWIGDERSTSSMHKDHYENLFYVLSGEKVFTLCPPSDVIFLHEGEFESGTFCQTASRNRDGKEWRISPDGNTGKVRWIEPDIDRISDTRQKEEFPLLSKCHPVQVTVSAGEMIYIPSLWFHRVTQTCETVGINYWYDMNFDSKWCYFNFLQNIVSEKMQADKNANNEED